MSVGRTAVTFQEPQGRGQGDDVEAPEVGTSWWSSRHTVVAGGGAGLWRQSVWDGGAHANRRTTVTYGAAKLSHEHQAKVQWKWHEWGSVFYLTLEALANLMPLVSSLLFIIYLNLEAQFYYECRKPGRNLPFVEKVLCEYTTPFVRDFPAIGTFLAINIVARKFSVQRVFYVGMRNGVFIDFQNTSLWDHHQVFLVIFYLIHIVVHHLVAWHCHFSADFYRGSYKRIAEFYPLLFKQYVCPIILYIFFAITQYGFEDYLLPMSRYLEENPRLAYRTLGTLQYIPEAFCDKLATQGMLATLEGQTVWEYFFSLIKEARKSDSSCRLGTTKEDDVSQFEDKCDELVEWEWISPQWTRMFIFATWWPTHILLDSQVCDEDSRAFRRAWSVYHAIALGVTMAIVVLFIMSLASELQNYDWQNWLWSAWDVIVHIPVVLMGLFTTASMVYQIYRGLR